jgi:hypothetical protein
MIDAGCHNYRRIFPKSAESIFEKAIPEESFKCPLPRDMTGAASKRN